MKDKFLKVALSQVGYKETPVNQTKYNDWYYGRHVEGNGYAWCCTFVSWCADQVGILGKLIPKYKGAGSGYNWFKDRNQITMKPKAGDIGFLKPTRKGAVSSHTFIVYDVLGDKITTIEGNIDNKVVKQTRRLTDSNILGFGIVEYPEIKYVDNVDYEGLNVRYVADGSKTGEVLQQATKVTIIKTEGKKAYLTTNTYVDKNYLVNNVPPFKVVNGADKDGLAVRKVFLGKPSKKALATLKNGHRVKVYKSSGKWRKVSPDSNAWVYGDYLK